MRYLTQFVLIIMLTCNALCAISRETNVNLAYFFQDSKADLTVLKSADADLEAFVNFLHQFDQNPAKKRVERISKEIEKRYFKVYKNESGLSDLFKLGHHNILSSTAIHGIIFTELKIPFQIQENQSGMNLIAYPNDERISVPYDGNQNLFHWTDKAKILAVNFLIDLEIATMAQANAIGYALIDKHFYKSNSITLKELSGLELLKRGIIQIGEAEFLKAIDLLATGSKNYKDVRFDYLQYGAMVNVIDNLTFDDILTMDYLLQVYNLTRNQATLDRFKSNIVYLYRAALNERRDFEFIKKSKILVDENLKRESDRDVILSDFYYIESVYYFNKRDNDKSLELVEKSLKHNPNNLESQDLCADLILNGTAFKILLIRNDSELITQYMDTLNNYEIQYPFLAESEAMLYLKVTIKCEQIQDLFMANNLKEGLKEIAELDKFLTEYDFENNEINELIAQAYSEVAIYYYRQRQYTVAKEWIDKAFKIDEDSGTVNQRKINIEAKL